MEEENICRLCLNLVKKEFEVIDEVTRQMFEVLSLKVDLNASKNPILCQDCAEMTTKSYYFKSACNTTEELILSFTTAKGGTEFDIKDVYVHCKDVKTVTSEDLNICRFCMNQVGRSSCVPVDILKNDELYVEMLPIFIPKMALNIIKYPVICTSCWENLEYYFKFMRNCLSTEEKINKYRQIQGICTTSQIKLSNVLTILFKDSLQHPDECAQITFIKQESLFERGKENENFEIIEQIKIEEPLDIKYEDNISCENLSNVPIDKCEVNVLKENGDKERDISVENTCEDASKVYTDMYMCGKCPYATKYKKCLKRHMLVHKDKSEVKMHKCGICTYETKYNSCLKKHLLTHKDASEVKMHKCPICTYETKHKGCLKNHELVHKEASQVEMYKCGLCIYETKHKYSLKKHRLRHKYTSEVEMYKCEICYYETKYKRCIKLHEVKHKEIWEVEVHKCEICTYETKYKSHLKNHLLIHKNSSKVEIHKCEICTYETRNKSHLKNHLLVHKNPLEVEMHKCGVCAFETKYKSGVKKHMLIHNRLRK